LAEIYKSSFMPRDLRSAHELNDKCVLALFGLKVNATDEQIMSELTNRYASFS
jgi:hypothetical protein